MNEESSFSAKNLAQKKHHPMASPVAAMATKMTRSRMSAFHTYETYFASQRKDGQSFESIVRSSTNANTNNNTNLPPKKRKISIDYSHADAGSFSGSSACKYPTDGTVETTITPSSSSISSSSPPSKTTLSFRRNSTDFSISTITSMMPIHEQEISNITARGTNYTGRDPNANSSTTTEPPPSSHKVPGVMRRIISSDSQEVDDVTQAPKTLSKKCKSRSKPNKPKPKPKIQTKRKKQNKYVPDRPMTTEETKAWRREARRVRNRQSAAASRQKVRDRIIELEAEATAWRTRYEEIMAKIAMAEERVGRGRGVAPTSTSSACNTETPSASHL